MRKKPRPGIRTDAGGGALFVTYVCYSSLAPFAKSRFQRFTLLPMRLQDAMLIFAHKMALPSHIHAGRFSCKHEICPQEYASEL